MDQGISVPSRFVRIQGGYVRTMRDGSVLHAHDRRLRVGRWEWELLNASTGGVIARGIEDTLILTVEAAAFALGKREAFDTARKRPDSP